MRHQVSGKHLGRTSAHRTALRRNLAASLFEHGTISTTRQKAKFVKPFAERLITLAKEGSLHARRRAIALLQNRDICTVENDESVKITTVIQKLFSEIGPRFTTRPGGYTRIINLPLRRLGDNGKLVLLQLVDERRKVTKTVRQTPDAASTVDNEESTEATDADALDEAATESAVVDEQTAESPKGIEDDTPDELKEGQIKPTEQA